MPSPCQTAFKFMKKTPTLILASALGTLPALIAQDTSPDTRQPTSLSDGATSSANDPVTLDEPIIEPTVADGGVADATAAAELPMDQPISTRLAEAGGFSTLETALAAADLTEVLSGPGPFTIFAPTNSAFEKIEGNRVSELLKPENKEMLRQVLLGHVVEGKKSGSDLTTGELTTIGSEPLDVVVSGEAITISGANVTMANMLAGNGVIHAIDEVLLPAEEE